VLVWKWVNRGRMPRVSWKIFWVIVSRLYDQLIFLIFQLLFSWGNYCLSVFSIDGRYPYWSAQNEVKAPDRQLAWWSFKCWEIIEKCLKSWAFRRIDWHQASSTTRDNGMGNAWECLIERTFLGFLGGLRPNIDYKYILRFEAEISC
jgi:hypothetical protein